MGKWGNQGKGATELEAPMPTFRWEEIQKHNLHTDKWLVIDRKVYNITKWSSRHPGGQRVIGHYAGEDATVRAWGLSRHPSPLQEGGRSRGPRASDKTSSAEWSLARGGGGVPEGRKSVYGAHLPLRILVPWHSWVSVPGGRILEPGGRSERWRSVQDLSRALGPLRPFLPSSSGARDSPKAGRRDPGTLAPPAWKMAAPGPRGEERERSQV